MHRPENAHKLSEMKEVLLKMMSYNKTTPICKDITVIHLIEAAPNSGSYVAQRSIPYEKRHAFFNPENQWSTPAMMAEDKDKVKEEMKEKLYDWNEPVPARFTEEDVIAACRLVQVGYKVEEVIEKLKSAK
jgi:hypothetical protein